MALFKKAMNNQAYLKAGFMGFQGSGKTHTATMLAAGLQKFIKSDKPIYFLDTETGSDWMLPKLAELGIEMFVSKTRAFSDLVPAIKEAEKEGSILVIDSITHFWRELTEAYAAKLNRKYGLQFQDWAYLKGPKGWASFTDAFVNSNCHIIMCGRAGYEYDHFENEGGKKELEKTGIKMKAEGETGFEPSLLVLMEQEMNLKNNEVKRIASVLKDRSDLIDGMRFENPTFKDFLPHVKFLNLGGKHVGVDSSRTSEGMIEKPENSFKYQMEQKELYLGDIEALLQEHHPGTGAKEKQAKLLLLKSAFDTGNWDRVKTFTLDTIKDGYTKILNELEGQKEPAQDDDAIPADGEFAGQIDVTSGNGHLPAVTE